MSSAVLSFFVFLFWRRITNSQLDILLELNILFLTKLGVQPVPGRTQKPTALWSWRTGRGHPCTW